MGRRNRVVLFACAFLSGFSLACVAVMLRSQSQGVDVPTHRLLMIASTAFVLAGLVGGALRTTYGRLVLAGLILCWLGDYLGPNHFEASLIAFLLAHVSFSAGFLVRGISRRRLAVTLGAFAAFSVFLGVWLLPHVPGKSVVLVVPYMLAITAMAGLSGAIQEGGGRMTVLFAASLFYLSDIFVARWRFVFTDSSNAYLCYPLYYAACVLLAFSILLYTPNADDARGS